MVDRLVNSEANARRISSVENCFGSSGQPLSVPGRVLVGEGILTKMCRKKPKPRQFFLFNDILVYGNIVINKKKYNKQHVIPLEEVKLDPLEDEGLLKNGWVIRTAGKSFAVYAATPTEKAEWMAHIQRCVTDLLKKSGKKAVENHAAVWVPDAEATACQICKTQFTFVNRRHHCRKCGLCICGACSKGRFLLPQQSKKPLRVCNNCNEILTSGAKGSDNITGTGNSHGGDNSSGEEDSDDDGDDTPSWSLAPKFYHGKKKTKLKILTPSHYEIVDVDDGRGNVEQVIITNEHFNGLSSEQENEADEFVGSRYGRYRPLLNGIIVIGPQIGKVLVALLGFLGLICILIFLYQIICSEIGLAVFYFGQFLISLCIIFLFWTSVTDPGVIPRDFNLNQYLYEIRNNNVTPPTRPRWCRKCHSARPPRCYHCRECDICIRRQDMHLVVGGLCIGSCNFRHYFAFNFSSSILSLYLISVSLTLIIKLVHKFSEKVFLRADFSLSCILLFLGAIVLSFPQTGLIMFVYRLYLLGKNRTVREEYRAYLRGNDYNPFDNGLVLNAWEFLAKSPDRSYLRRKKNQVDPYYDGRHRWKIAADSHMRDSRIIYCSPLNFTDPNRISAEPQSYVEKENIRQNLNVHAKVKSHISLPLLDHGELPLISGTRFRLSLYPKPLQLLQQQIKQYHVCQTIPKCVVSTRKLKASSHSLSESCLSETVDASDIVHQARAFQLQQIIGCVIRRDRLGLIDLARRIDVAGLIGMDRFDPDDIQMIELTNGLPLITARSHGRRPPPIPGQENLNPQPVQVMNQPRRNNNALGIPQMVAAGLMPTIRRQQQQAVASLALTRLHPPTINAITLSPTTIRTNSRTGSNVVYVPPGINRQSIFRYDHCNRRRLALSRPHITSNSPLVPTRPAIPARASFRQNNLSNLVDEERNADSRVEPTSSPLATSPGVNNSEDYPPPAQSSNVDSNTNNPVCLIFVNDSDSTHTGTNANS
ncbi:unnamed protein product [Allacma fusca]|uniref:Uncharacterized protein n=1 Tax=Allacma fusca TaxID=39272 RepID=A0A8J2PMG8_9HEXA|nr:unnamed protein product [Allacma fusca]